MNKVLCISFCALALGASLTMAADWSQWGGRPMRNMYSPAKGLPDRFEPGKFKPNSEVVEMSTTKNVRWVSKLGSQSYGNVTVAGGKVFVGTKDADIIWVYDMMDELGVFPHNASNCSLLVVDDIVYACTSNGQDWTHSNIPQPNSPSFIALNKQTGEFLGEDDAKISQRIFHGQWSSPALAVVN